MLKVLLGLMIPVWSPELLSSGSGFSLSIDAPRSLLRIQSIRGVLTIQSIHLLPSCLTSRVLMAQPRLLSCIETGNDDPVFTVYGTDQAIISSKGLLRNGALEPVAPGFVKLRMPLTRAYSFLFVIYKEELF